MLTIRILLIVFSVLLLTGNAFSQITLNQTTVNNYVATICGPGITFSNATLTGDDRAIANFAGGTSGGLGATMNSGVVMSTGFVNAAGTLQGGAGVHRSDNNSGPSIPELNAIAGAGTNDGIILEFDFIPITNQINVNFQFGSEEYNEYVNGGYNDAFAFFISGPGIVGTPNIAVVPGVGTPVTIDNINRGYAAGCGTGCTNCAFYNDNCTSAFNNCMDGFTTMLTASQAVIPCSTYHIRLMIADGGDSIYDSWVFVQENGLFAVGDPPVTFLATSGVGNGVVPEGCENSYLTFSIPDPLGTPYSFNVTWGGTATPGVDYDALPSVITIPAGATSIDIPVNVYFDGIAEGMETITCTYPATVCDIGQATITIEDAHPLAVTASADVFMCGASGVPVSAASTGGSGTITYTWDNGAGTGTPVTVSPASTTTYTVTATDQCGHTDTDQVVVNVTDFTALTAVPSNCNAGNQYTVSGTVSFTAAPPAGTLTIASSCGGSQVFSAPFTSPVSYTLTGLAADGANCTVTASFGPDCEISQTYTAPSLPAVDAGVDVAVCTGDVTTLTATGAATYSWDNGLGSGNSHTVSPVSATTYTVIGTAANGCTGTDQVVVTVNSLPVITASPDISICNGSSSTISASGGTSYTWDNGLGSGSSHTVLPAATTTYTVTGTDANGCVNTDQVTVTVNPLPVIAASADSSICIGSSATISVSGGVSYTWDNGLGSGNAHTVSPAATTTYTVTGTDANGCMNTDQVTITVNPLPSIVASIDESICDQSSTIISASGGNSYSWNNGLGSGSSHTVSPASTTTYTVTGTDVNGCINTDQVVITVLPLPAATISGTITVCQEDVAPVITFEGTNGSSDYAFTYSLNGGTSQTITTSGTNEAVITVPTTTSGTFTYVLQSVEDVATGCSQSQSGTAAVTVNPLPDATIAGTVTVCQEDAAPVITFEGSNSSTDYTFSYSVNNGTTQTITASGTNTATVSVPTTTAGTFVYELINVSDPATGCNRAINEIQTVTVNPLPDATIAGTITVCQEDAAPVITFEGSNSSADYTFSYSVNNGTAQTITASGSNTATVSVPTTAAGTFVYELINVSDPATGCSRDINETQTVTVNPLPAATISGTITVCQEDVAPVVTFEGTNGSSDYTFTYSLNGGASQTITTSGTNEAVITVPTTTSGTFTYVLQSVEDVATGCSQSQSGTATVTVNPLPDATIVGTIIVCQQDASPVITFEGSNSSTDYTFSYSVNNGTVQTIISSGSNIATVSVPTTTAGTFVYELINVSDPSTGCNRDINETQTVTVNPLPAATISGTITVCQEDVAPVVTFEGTNGSSDYTFTYSLNGGASQTITTSGTNEAVITVPTTTSGTFTYVLQSVEDVATGCFQSQSGTATVTVNPLPDATIAGTITVCQEDAAPVITFEGTNSSDAYVFTYSINNGTSQTITASGSNTATVSVPTTTAGTFVYELINVSDPSTGCNRDINEIQTVTVNPLPTASISGTVVVCQGEAAQQITIEGANGSSDYQFVYSLNNGSQQVATTSGSSTISITVPTTITGTYVYTLHSVEDISTGCIRNLSDSAMVTVNPSPDATISGTAEVCQGAAEPVITFEGTNSTQDFLFSYNVNGTPQSLTASGTDTATANQSTAVPGTYVYTLTNVTDPSTGCSSDLNLTATVVIKALPVATISAPVEACHFDMVLPEVHFEGADGDAPYLFTYNINGGADQYATSNGGSTVIFPVTTGTVGTFIYTITYIREGSLLECQQTQNVSTIVTIHDLPSVSAGSDFSVCAGQPVTLSGSGAATYVWDNGVTNNAAFTPSNTATYTVTGTDNNGCSASDEITVTIVPIPDMDFEGENLYGCQPVTATFTNMSSGNLTDCKWYFGNGEVVEGCGTVSSTFENPGCFDVTLVVSTPEGCTNTLTVTDFVCVESQPVADFNPVPDELTTYNWETQLENLSLGADHYEWNFGDGSALSSEHSPTHSFPNETGGVYTITLVASTNAGCVDTAYYTIELKDELLFFVPNTFTPDGDNHNNTFLPVFTSGYDPYGYTLMVFNRWGEMIFESHDASVGWDGTYGVDGKICQNGTYTWKIEVKTTMSDERKMFVGHINLLR